MSADVDFVAGVVKALVDLPDAVSIERTVDDMGVLLTLKVDKSDMGKIIGKKGRIISAIRTLLGALGMKLRARINLKVWEPEGSRNESNYDSNANFSSTNEDPTNVSDLV
ncbi:MAG: hypothetical protein Fur0024_0420 [Patescibacteria group bacterium]